VRFVPHATSPLRPGELARVERLVRAAFSTRRKTLANALRGAGIAAPGAVAPAALLANVGLDARVRAEEVSPVEFLALARALAERDPGAEA
jgi:16S rRNA (adenine1518-N6/adenine1519-N6)-dimethyltransferase